MAVSGKMNLQRVATRNPADGEEVVSWVETLSYAYNDTDLSLRFAASAANPVIVMEVKHVVLTAIDDTIDIGDGSDADYWIDNVVITEATPGDTTSSFLATVPRAGRRYTSNGEVKVTVGGSATGGTGLVVVHLVQL